MVNERHLFVAWHNSIKQIETIEKILNENFYILKKISVKWSSDLFAENMSRFYSYSLTDIAFKVNHCGIGDAILFVVEDYNLSNYDFIETSRGYKKINLKQFQIKEDLRKVTGGGHLIHSSNNEDEFKRDLSLLLGLNAKYFFDYDFNDFMKIDVECVYDLAGQATWNSIDEMFFVLNYSENYLVLRNFKDLMLENSLNDIRDIDFLVYDKNTFLQIINAKSTQKEDYRSQYIIKIKNQGIFIDVRYVNDNYYCDSWEREMLNTRVLFRNTMYIPSEDHYLPALIYHFFIHKSYINADYLNELRSIFYFNNRNELLKKSYYFLLDFMDYHHYYFIKPCDLSVGYDTKYVELQMITSEIIIKLGFEKLDPIGFDWKSGSNSIHFIGTHRNSKYFVKYSSLIEPIVREINFLKDYGSKYEFIPKIFRYLVDKSYAVLSVNYIDGFTLDYLKTSEIIDTEKENIINQLVKISNVLQSDKVIHRDIKPDNIMYSYLLKSIYLLDWQFVLVQSNSRYQELNYVKENLHKFRLLGTSEYNVDNWNWSDKYSISVILSKYFQFYFEFNIKKDLRCYYPIYSDKIISRIYYKLFPKKKYIIKYSGF